MSTVVMIFNGEYDVSNKVTVRAELTALSDEPNLVLDFSDVTYMDSICISELVRMREYRMTKQLEKVTIVQSSRSVGRLFEILNLGSVFNVVGTLDEVLPKDGTSIIVQYASAGSDPALEASDLNITTERGSVTFTGVHSQAF